jgi:hypothetical protein
MSGIGPVELDQPIAAVSTSDYPYAVALDVTNSQAMKFCASHNRLT